MVPHTNGPHEGENERIELKTDGFEEFGGKSLSRATLIAESREYGPEKLVLELESPDGYQYRFQRFETGDDARFTYMNRENPNGDVSATRGNLPAVTDAYLANISGNDPRRLAVEPEPEPEPEPVDGERAVADGGRPEVALDLSVTPPRQHDLDQLPDDATDWPHVERATVATAEAENARMCGRCYAATDGGVVETIRGPTPGEFRAYAAEEELHGHCVNCGTRTNETNDEGQTMCEPCQRDENAAQGAARADGGYRYARPGRGQETLGDAYQRSRVGVSGDPVPDAEYADEPPAHAPTQPVTTYTIHLPSTYVTTTDPDRAERESRAGRPVTATTRPASVDHDPSEGATDK